MTLEQRAQQFWSVLIFAAREQKLVSYSLLSQITGFSEAGIVLHCLSCYCRQHNLPPLNVIALDPMVGRPDVFSRDLRDWSAQQSRVFLYDWLQHPAPSEEMFREAIIEDEELERAGADYIDVPCRC